MNHHYMVLGDLNLNQEDYRYRMMTGNAVRGLLTCSMHSVNGSNFLYYETDSRQSLSGRFGSSHMKYEELQALMRAIRELLDRLEDYLLGEKGILFSADMIYVRMDEPGINKDSFEFVFCPAETEGYDFLTFTEQLLDLVQDTDDRAAEMIYGICDMAQEDSIRLRDLLAHFLKEEQQEVSELSDGEPSVRAAMWDPEIRRDGWNTSGQIEEEKGDRIPEFPDVSVGGNQEQEQPSPERSISMFVMAGLFLLVFLAMVGIRVMYVLDYRENILSLSVLGVTGGMSLLSVVLGVRRILRNRGNGCGGRERDREQIEEFTYARMEMPRMESERVSTYKYGGGQSESTFRRKQDEPGDQDPGETVVLSQPIADHSYRLNGKGSAENIHIATDFLPLTLGKMAGCVDFVLKDPSVSRIHARLYRQNPAGPLLIKDLNSTNGTFHNGMRLKPNESVPVLPGDEVGFGSLCFDYR